MARSFFERLTGSVRIDEGEDRDAARAERVRAAGIRPKKPDDRSGEDASRVLHPVGENSDASRRAEEQAEPEEEGQLTVDIYDDGQDIVIQSTVAGVRPDDIDITLQEETLTVRGRRKRVEEVRDDSFYYRELYWGAFTRSIILPEEVDFSKAEATIKNGMLTIRLPKKDKGEKKIKVRVG